MKNGPLFIGLTLFLVVSAIATFFLLSPKESGVPSDSSRADTVQAENLEIAQTDESIPSGGQYLPYSSSSFENIITPRRVFFFYANWCPTCKPADQSFTQNTARIPADLTIVRVNYNDTETDEAEKELARKYGITYQHTFVQVDKQGNELAKWNGGKIDELLEKIQ